MPPVRLSGRGIYGNDCFIAGCIYGVAYNYQGTAVFLYGFHVIDHPVPGIRRAFLCAVKFLYELVIVSPRITGKQHHLGQVIGYGVEKHYPRGLSLFHGAPGLACAEQERACRAQYQGASDGVCNYFFYHE